MKGLITSKVELLEEKRISFNFLQLGTHKEIACESHVGIDTSNPPKEGDLVEFLNGRWVEKGNSVILLFEDFSVIK